MGTHTRKYYVESTWACSSCGAKNLGRDMGCATCGAPKDKREAYDSSSNVGAPPIDDPRLLALARADRNWSCGFCGADNRAEASCCVQCGAASRSPPVPADAGPLDRDALGLPAPWWQRVSRALKSKVAMVGYAIAVVGGVLLWIFVPREVTVTVDRITWTYTRALEERETVHDSGWGHPEDAFDVHCSRRFKETEDCRPHDCRCHEVAQACSRSCNCHTTCYTSCSDKGNGFSECTETCSEQCDTCEEPCGSRQECDTCYDRCDVYDDWCEYDYFAWREIDREVTSGHDHDVSWGDRLVARGQSSSPQRITQTEKYDVELVDGDRHWRYAPRSLVGFRRFDAGARWRINVNRAGHVEPISLQAAPP